MAIGSPEISEICVVGPIWRHTNAGNLKPFRGLYPFCANPRIIFLGSASLKLPFDIMFWCKHGTMAIGSPEVSEICIVGPIWRNMNASNLKPRSGLYTFCTNLMIIFMCFASLKLPFDINIVLVQTRYHGDRKPEVSEICIFGPIYGDT